MTDKEKATREYLQTLTKDRVIELCLQYIFDKNVVETQLEEKEKMHLLDEKEFQHYCAYKWIEPEIKGCLDREREYKKQLAEKDKEIKELNALLNAKEKMKTQSIDGFNKLKRNQTQLAIQELEKVEDFAFNYVFQQIKELSGGKNGKF